MGLRLDLHIHSKYSNDSFLEPDAIVRIARARGLHGVAITDHNTAKGAFEALSAVSDPVPAAGVECSGFMVIPGVEYSTQEGHVVGLFIQKEPDVSCGDGTPVLPLAQIVDAIHAAGGIAVLAHPFQSRLSLNEGLLVDAVEGFNCRAGAVRNPRANHQAEEFARKNHMPMVGGSDAHFAWEIGRGGCVLRGLRPVASLEEVREAVLSGRAEPFGCPSPRMAVPLSGLAKAWKTRRFAKVPKYVVRLVLSVLGPLGSWLEDLARGPVDG